MTELAHPGWSTGASRRFVVLAASRGAAQLLAVVWFLVAARRMGDAEFGSLATGLAFFAVFAGLGDAGTTRTVVRHVSQRPDAMWRVHRGALIARCVTGAAVGAAVVALIALTPTTIGLAVVALAGVVATLSGATELGYAVLRTVGRIRLEAVLLVAERVAFVVAALVVLDRGGGAAAVLCVYAVTNAFSAVAVTVAIHRHGKAFTGDPVSFRFADREGRATAASFALVTIIPRIAPVILALAGVPAAVGAFAVGQRPIEALALFALSSAAPLLPLIRWHLLQKRASAAEAAAGAVAGSIAAGMAPVIAWFLVRPDDVVRAVFGEGRYSDGDTVLRWLALTAVTWCFRGVGEFVLLGEERAERFLAVVAAGAASIAVACVALVPAYGAVGAAASVALGEVVVTALLVQAAPTILSQPRQHFGPAAVLAVGTSAALVLVGGRFAGQAGVVVISVAAGLFVAWRHLRSLEVPQA